ncbi:MAG: hypothetical protein AVDCRST_MAG56-6942 [uncultured Cytophagales bacterium]|uniref:Outer membrane protein beta-barrel domain-containing protein n=1 Tax=uncultured Cytophagales bacterium TaxID=158755 RepID=A0A6J4L1W4_9SPHI|nr:MAG: hypothetical protein AVDCRST_MAG56-6942 [uncultured Cytophagales bacterium]
MNQRLPSPCRVTSLSFCLFFALLSAAGRAQPPEPRKVARLLEVGVAANAYRGDLATKYQKWSSAFQLGLKLNGKKRLNGHFNLGIGTVTGQNPDYQYTGAEAQPATPNVYFKTSYVSLNYDLQVNLVKSRHWIAYLSQGAGLFRFSPKDERNQALAGQLDTRAEEESYNNITVLLPTQAGVTYLFDNGYGVGMQSGWLNPQNDYLDNISQWGNRSKKDNVLSFRFSFVAPIAFAKP